MISELGHLVTLFLDWLSRLDLTGANGQAEV